MSLGEFNIEVFEARLKTTEDHINLLGDALRRALDHREALIEALSKERNEQQARARGYSLGDPAIEDGQTSASPGVGSRRGAGRVL